MFKKTINTIVAGMVVLSLITSADIMAQSSFDHERKTKKSALLLKSTEKPMLPFQVLNSRYKTDNDIGRITDQWA